MGLPYGAEKPADIYDEQLRRAAEKYPQLKGIDFTAMKDLAYIQIPYTYKKYEERGRFNTPTGKVELYSTVFEKLATTPCPTMRSPGVSPLFPRTFEGVSLCFDHWRTKDLLFLF